MVFKSIICMLLSIIFFYSSIFSNNYVIKGDFIQKVILTGSIHAKKAEYFTVPRNNTWQIQIKWMPEEGTEIKPGDPVVRFDTSNLVNEIENIEVALEVLEQEIDQKKFDNKHQQLELDFKVKKAKIEYKKAEIDASVPKGILSLYEYDKGQMELKKRGQELKDAKIEKIAKTKSMKTELEKKNIEIKQKREELENYKKMLKGLTIYSKTAGALIYAKHPWEDRKIQIGDEIFTSATVASIPDINSLEIKAWANEGVVESLNTGQRVDIYLDAYPDKHLYGKIIDISKSAGEKKQWGKSHYFMVIISLDSLDLKVMKPGMSVKCEIKSFNLKNVLKVPLNMVFINKNEFWIKPINKDPMKIDPIKFNKFYCIVKKSKNIHNGLILQRINNIEKNEKKR